MKLFIEIIGEDFSFERDKVNNDLWEIFEEWIVWKINKGNFEISGTMCEINEIGFWEFVEEMQKRGRRTWDAEHSV